jgi:hypothetical protein
MKALYGALALVAVVAGRPLCAQPEDACSHDVFTVDGTVVGVALCPGPDTRARKDVGRGIEVGIAQTFSAKGASFVQTVNLEFMDSGEASRTIEDVSLEPLGIPKSLHLTIGFAPRAGTVRLEHALLVPGALTLK